MTFGQAGSSRASRVILLGMGFVLAGGCVASAKKTIVHWQHDAAPRTAAVRQFAAEFEKLNLDIEVKVQTTDLGTYMDKVLVALAAGSGPNVCQLPSGLLPEYISKKILAPVPVGVITADFAKQNIHAFINSRLMFRGKLYGMPTDVQTMVLYSNTDLLAQAGLDPAKPPRSWADLKQYAIKLTKRDASGKSTQSGFNWGNYTVCLINFMLANGVTLVDDDFTKLLWDTRQGVDAIEYLTDFNTKYRTMDSGDFTTGKGAMVTGHTVFMGELRKSPKLKYRVSAMPVPEGRPDLTVGSHWAYVVPRAAKNSDAAWKWIRWLTSKENQVKWFQRTGDLPAFRDLVDKPDFKLDANMEAALNTLPSAQPLTLPGWMEWDQVCVRMMTSVISGKKRPAEALRAATVEGNLILKRKGLYLKDF